MDVDVSKISRLQRVKLAKRAIQRMAAPELPSDRPGIPEQQMWLSVILQAVEDLALPKDMDPAAAHRYFIGAFPFDRHAELALLDADAVRLVLKQALLIEEEGEAAA